MSLEYVKDKKIDGINTYEYRLSNNTFSKSNPNNEGVFTDDDYLGDGVQSLSKCMKSKLKLFKSTTDFI